MVKKAVLLFICLLSIQGLWAQGNLNSFNNGADSLLDARMKARNEAARAGEGKYNASSTRFTFEENFKFNNINFVNPDTIPDNLHRISAYESSNYLIQNLGNVGTAQRSLFYQIPQTIGRTSGYNAYDAFFTTPNQIRYFDTRSPYTEVEALFAGGGRAITRVTFTLNDSTQFNIGGSFNAIRSEKQLAFLTRGDRQVTSNDWNIFGFWRPKKVDKYLLLFNFRQFKHDVVEQGGIVDPELLPDDLVVDGEDPTFFDGRDSFVYLEDAQSYDNRGGFHIYQQYDLDSIFQLYHIADYKEQLVRYNDNYDLSGYDQYIYDDLSEPSGRFSERTTFKAFANELGLKGRTRTFSYTTFYRNRLVRQEIARGSWGTTETEHYIGGTLRQQITPKVFLTASGEFLFGGNYLISGNFSSDFFEATYSRVVRKPSFLEDRYLGLEEVWNNQLSNENSDNIQGTLKIDMDRLSFRPFLRFSRIGNYIYFNEQKEPEQASGDVVLLTPGLQFDYQISDRWQWSNTVRYNSVAGGSGSVYRLPEVMALSQIAYRDELFQGRMIIQAGVDLFYQTAYEPLAYTPVTQQFYLQNGFESDAFLKGDIFLNFKVQSIIITAKMGHLNQPNNGGYFITPNFTGYERTLDLGVRWLFFD